MKKTICVAAHRRGAYSQTFVRSHMKLLPACVKELYLAEFPQKGRNEAIKTFLISNKIEAVLAEFGRTGVHMMKACLETAIPLIVLFGGEDAYSEAPKWLNVRTQYPFLFRTASAVIVVSGEMKKQLITLGANPDSLKYCTFGADTALFCGARPSINQPTFLAVGRFVDKKAPYLTLIAFQKVVEHFKEAKLVMVGDGELFEVCQRLTKALNLGSHVELRGVLSHEQVAEIMRHSRCFVQHSVRSYDGNSEGTPNTVIEAGASGLPVIATDHAGIPEVVVHGKTGFLVQEGDVSQMASYMLRLARDGEEAEHLGTQARLRVINNFSLEHSIEQLWRVIDEAKTPNLSFK